MREFSSTNYRLTRAPYWQKIIYSVFLAFMVIGIATSLLLGLTRTGFTPAQIRDHYRGNPDRMQFGVTFQELLDVTHMHAFVMPLVLLVLAHLFLLTDWPDDRKRGIVVLAVAAVAGMVLAPWGVRYGPAFFAYMHCAAFLAFVYSFIFLIGVPIYDMWFRNATDR